MVILSIVPYLEAMMNHGLSSSLEQIKSDCLVIGLFDDTKVTELLIKPALHALVAHLQKKLIEPGDTIYRADDQDAQEILLIHCGEKKKYSPAVLKTQIEKIVQILTTQRLSSATLVFPQLEQYEPDWQMEHMVMQFEAAAYQFLDFKTKNATPYALKSIEWYLPGANETAVQTGQIIADSIRYTRNLANLPANICTPTYLAKQAHILDVEWDSITGKMMSKAVLDDLGMGALLAVAKGSIEPPQLIQLTQGESYYAEYKNRP